MIGLEDGMLLYHGSYVSIPDIDLSRCMGSLDFGRGFLIFFKTPVSNGFIS